jgi:hypothetical protein
MFQLRISTLHRHGRAPGARFAARSIIGAHRVFASDLRNPNGMAWESVGGAYRYRGITCDYRHVVP